MSVRERERERERRGREGGGRERGEREGARDGDRENCSVSWWFTYIGVQCSHGRCVQPVDRYSPLHACTGGCLWLH